MQRPSPNEASFQVKECANSDLQVGMSPSQDARAHGFYEMDHIPQQQQPPGFGSWSFLVNTWADAEVDFQLLQPDALVDDVQIPLNVENSGLQTLVGNPETDLSSSKILHTDQDQTSLHSFLPCSPMNASASNNPSIQTGPGLAISQETSFPDKIQPNDQSHKGLSSGPVTAHPEESMAQVYSYVPEPHIMNPNKENIQDHIQNQNRLTSGNFGSSVPLSYGLSNGQLYMKGQVHGGSTQIPTKSGKELGLTDLQLWQQQQQHLLYSQHLQELYRQQQIQYIQQYSQLSPQQQLHQFLAFQNHLVGSPLMPVNFGNSIHGYSQSAGSNIVPDDASIKNRAQTFVCSNLSNANPQVVGSSLNNSLSMQGSISDVPVGHGQSMNWQTLLLKGSQLDPSFYGPLMASFKDASESNLASGSQNLSTGLYDGDVRFSFPSQVEKPIPYSTPPGNLFGSDVPMDSFAMTNSQNNMVQDYCPSTQEQASGMPLAEQTVQQMLKATQTIQKSLKPVSESNEAVGKHQESSHVSVIQQHFQDLHGQQPRIWMGHGQNKAGDLQNISLPLSMAGNLSRSSSGNNVRQSDLSIMSPAQPASSADTRILRISPENSERLSCRQAGDSNFTSHSMPSEKRNWTGDLSNCSFDDGQQQRDSWSSLPSRQTEVADVLHAVSSHKRNIWGSNHPISSVGFHHLNGVERTQLHMLHEQNESAKVGSLLPVNQGGTGSSIAQESSHPYAEMESGATKSVWSLPNANDGNLCSFSDQTGHQLTGGLVSTLQKLNVDARMTGKVWTDNMQQNISEAEGCKVTSGPNGLHNSGNQHAQASHMQQNISEVERCKVTSGPNGLHNFSNQHAQSSHIARNMLSVNVDASPISIQNCHLYSHSQQTLNPREDYSKKSRSQEHAHVGGGARQICDQQIFGNQNADARMGPTFERISSIPEIGPCPGDISQIQGSVAMKACSRQIDNNDASEDHDNICYKPDYSNTSPRSFHVESNKPLAEVEDCGKSAANLIEHDQNLSRQLNMNRSESLCKEASASRISHLGALSASHLLHLHTYKGPLSRGMPNVGVCKMIPSNGGNVGQTQYVEENMKPYNILNSGKNFAFSKSQSNISIREKADFQLNSSADMIQSSIADKASGLDRPVHSSSSLPRQLSGDEQYGLHNKGRVSLPNMSSSSYNRNQLPSSFLPRSLGLALTPSYMNLQQGYSCVNNSIYVQKVHSNTSATMVTTQVHTQPKHTRRGAIVETTESQPERCSDTNIHSIVNPNISMTSGLNSNRTSSIFDSGQPALASLRHMQISNPAQIVMSSQNSKVLASPQKESSITTIHPQPQFVVKGSTENYPVACRDFSFPYTGCVHQLQEAQGAQSLNPLNNSTNFITGQQKLPAGQEKQHYSETEPIHPSTMAKSGSGIQFQPYPQADVGFPKNMESSAVGGQNQPFESHVETHVLPKGCSKFAIDRNENSHTSRNIYELNPSALQAQVQEARRHSPGRLPPSAFQNSRFSAIQVSGLSVMQEQGKFSPPRDNTSLLKLFVSGSQHSQLEEAKSLSTDKIPNYVSGRAQNSQLQDAGVLSDKFLDYAFSHKHSLQQTDTSSEGLSVSQTSENLSHSDFHGVHISEPMTMARSKQASTRKPPKHNAQTGNMSTSKVKGKPIQQNSHHTSGLSQNITLPELRSPQEQVSMVLESQSKFIQRSLKETRKLSYVQKLPQKEALTTILGGGVEVPEGILRGQIQEGPSAIYPDQEEKIDGHVLASQVASTHENIVSIGGIQVGGFQSSTSKTPDNSVAGSGPSQSCNGVADISVKEGESRLFEMVTSGTLDQSGMLNFDAPAPDPPRKRKKLKTPPIPWYISMTKPAGKILSTSGAELVWAASTNRLTEKDDNEADVPDEGAGSITQAKRRLKLTTQLLQQLIPPLPSTMMQGSNAIDYESATYSIAKCALRDACQLVTDCQEETNPSLLQAQDHDRTRGNSLVTKNSSWERFSGSCINKIKQVESELANLEGSTSMLELKNDLLAGETLSIVNRLARHHGRSFPLDSFENLCAVKEFPCDSGQVIHRPLSQRYVTALPMPRTLPEGVKCLSL